MVGLPYKGSKLMSQQDIPSTPPPPPPPSLAPEIPNQPTTPPKKKRSKLQIGCLGIIALLLCSAIVGIGNTITGGSKTPTAETQPSGTSVAAGNVTSKPTATTAEKPTATPKPPTATATPLPTAVPPPDKAQAVYLDPRILAADPKAHIGEHIYLQGKTLTVDQKSDYTWVQIQAQVKDKDFVNESMIVEVRPKQTGLLRAECYRIYGIVKGTTKVTRTATGAENEVPLISGYAFEPAPPGQYGGCANP